MSRDITKLTTRKEIKLTIFSGICDTFMLFRQYAYFVKLK